MASNLKRSKRTVGRRILDLQTKVSGLQKRVGPTSIGQNAVSTSSLQPGAVGGWVVDANSIYTGVKTATGTYAPTGSITIGSDGHITANKFRIDANGDAFFTGAISGGTIDIGGFDSSSFHVDASGNMWLGGATFATSSFSVSAAGTVTATAGQIGTYIIYGDRLESADAYGFRVRLETGSIRLDYGADYTVSANGQNIEGNSIDGSWIIRADGSADFSGEIVVNGENGLDNYFLNNGTYFERTDALPVLHLERGYGAGGDFVRFRNFTNDTEVGRIEFASTTTIAYQTSSDARLKENMRPIENPIEKVKGISPVSYNFIIDPDNTLDGFIAQDVYSVYPQVVSVGAEDVQERTWAVNYAGLTPLLTAAIKEIIERLEDLESRN